MPPVNVWPQLEGFLADNGVEPLVIRIFGDHVSQVAQGAQGTIREADIEPVQGIECLEHLPTADADLGRQYMARTVILKLNGGLGTSMGLQGPKSLLPVRDGYTFLDLIVEQTSCLNMPLLMMNSFSTDADTRRVLAEKQQGDGETRIATFTQHRIPKLMAENLAHAQWNPQPELAWCPPGHGDLYASLVTTGTLVRLLAEGYRYLFVSNADNLGALFDPRVLGYMVRGGHTFLMEVADRTEADRKGGHLAQRADGKLLLRESAQCHDDDRAAFGDIEKYRFFNTNNLWIDLPALASTMQQYNNQLPLSLIVNRKTVDPTDPASPPVLQLETAMGSAISVMPRATALRVPRTRLTPVKTTNDLLAVRSDAYHLAADYSVQLIGQRNAKPPVVDLDPHWYRTIQQFEDRIREIPSLKDCSRLTIEGEVRLRQPTTMLGNVTLTNGGSTPVELPAGEYRGENRLQSRA